MNNNKLSFCAYNIFVHVQSSSNDPTPLCYLSQSCFHSNRIISPVPILITIHIYQYTICPSNSIIQLLQPNTHFNHPIKTLTPKFPYHNLHTGSFSLQLKASLNSRLLAIVPNTLAHFGACGSV